MGWLDKIDIGKDIQICPDCDRKYEVLQQFLGNTQNRLTDWIDDIFNETFYVELRCPQCLETRYLCIQTLTPTQFHTEKEKLN